MKKHAATMAALLVLAGCGSAGSDTGSHAGTDAEKGAAMVGDCPVTSTPVTEAKTLASADLDGDGTAEPVKVTAPGGDCSTTMFAKLGEGYVATAIPTEPAVSSAFAVDPGTGGQLVVTKADHPRGGYQLRIYAAGADALTELEVDGRSLLPFVATDVQEHPISIDCGDGGLVVTEAAPHEPPGVAAAWDIRQTTYAVDGTQVTAGATKEIADNVLPRDLATKYPDLVKHSAFESCRA